MRGIRTCVLTLLVLGLASLSWAPMQAASFTNSTAIVLPLAGAATPYPSTIAVSGLSGTIVDVSVTFHNFTHPHLRDVSAMLVGPGGHALLLINSAGGGEGVSNITFTISDLGFTNLQDLLSWGNGTYKPTQWLSVGPTFPAPAPASYGEPGPLAGHSATLTNTFGGTNPNGTWSLYAVDFIGGNSGQFAGGWTLNIKTTADVPAQHVLDFDADGRTDFTVVRNTTGGGAGQIRWFALKSATGVAEIVDWGVASDTFMPADYDGDHKTDYAIWRPGAPGVAAFYIVQSSTGTLRLESFGQTGDQAEIAADYDGNGSDDIAVYRPGASAGAPSTWYYRTTAGGPVFAIPWGQNGDFVAPGDYDGDGKGDFMIQRNAGGGQARFWLRRANSAIESVVFGTPTDVIVPGDYDGDGRTDIAVVRGVSGQLLWSVRESLSGATVQTLWGNSATDFVTQGDYDGDKKTDLAVWRPNVDPALNYFFVLGSAGSALFQPWGLNGDYPVANWNAH